MGVKAYRALEAVGVIAGAVVAYFFVPNEILIPGAWIALAVAVAGVYGAKAYLKKLDPAEDGQRRFLVMDAATMLTLVGIAAFLILLWEYGD